ncbi:lipopolysaccharide transport system permease protein [Novimethylophilus kurashikiensis]|uniref:Transport permease protein n=2 Tax=Novimethylophilus kurashikiensis TaxID=1825523 RepID=A0A2R5F8Q3_9PROT|nr:lipopolysaccharide transport system permease protein [Novimethylophilus kurashikiensis]
MIFQPLITVGIFTLLFGRLAGIPSDGLPYPIFALTGLLPWQYFSKSVLTGSNSLVANKGILTKTYFPRLILPLSGVLAGLADLAIGLTLLLCLMLWYGLPLSLHLLVLPVLLVMVVLLAFGLAVTLAGLNAIYRDISLVLPFVMQVLMYSTPIIYSVGFIPPHWQWLIKLNPMTGIITSIRWAVLGIGRLDSTALWISMAWIILLIWAGVRLFKRLEAEFVDRL